MHPVVEFVPSTLAVIGVGYILYNIKSYRTELISSFKEYSGKTDKSLRDHKKEVVGLIESCFEEEEAIKKEHLTKREHGNLCTINELKLKQHITAELDKVKVDMTKNYTDLKKCMNNVLLKIEQVRKENNKPNNNNSKE